MGRVVDITVRSRARFERKEFVDAIVDCIGV